MADENKKNEELDIAKLLKDGFEDIKESIKSINVSRETSNQNPPPQPANNQDNAVLNAINSLKETITKTIKEDEGEGEEGKTKEKITVEVPEIPEKEEPEGEKPEEKKKVNWMERILRG
jgi:hypothetical protein